MLTFFTLAEEGGSGKVVLLEKGGYEGMDACLMSVHLGQFKNHDV